MKSACCVAAAGGFENIKNMEAEKEMKQLKVDNGMERPAKEQHSAAGDEARGNAADKTTEAHGHGKGHQGHGSCGRCRNCKCHEKHQHDTA